MIRSAAKLGFFGAISYFFAKAFYSLLSLLVVFLGASVLLGCLFAWFYFATTSGWLMIE